MRNKTFAIMLTGVIALSMAACGNQANEQAMGSVTQESKSAPTAAEHSYKTTFQTSVFLGDSIMEGLSFHDVLDEANVSAGAGKTAEFALEDVNDLAKRNPKHIFIQLGSDDILWPTEDPLKYSYKHYAKLINSIKERLPKAKITILSVTPVTVEAEQKEPRYQKIVEYNKGLQELASEEKVAFVDLSPIFTNSLDLYDKDGIHFNEKYYKLLLDLLKDYVN
ncbi:GDSL-type esterase/lipase family protein [Brevibacillus laterosporus]|uniref:GDSL-type esterase/lipase family protein n=1 Tax=Brevibacillus laterosporus TaxID=1465 RepID=A0AAP3DGS2_BRELA|nr:GDSL-type esterase/lipase family protein [Brevibacillus laterosporus]MCR8980593.1 GDSL-type esterase/lipase family protein [Brevibacillus laterosporus]MCZ0807748.1 GDSL-type esterase/lipase family protein [Brevibacillus laterosporus]MCZ0826024.1 GDSL-type esterase/lipase family protein [Brevibacillus laterosporus]MCZ0849809.1 GDSL-type esterase/lipase family protein [Brevibacillus laterosporus]